MRRPAVAALLALAGAAACAPENGALMRPGEDCLSCHDGGGARRWTAAGTFPGRGRTVVIGDANGRSLTLHTNRVGSLYTAEPLAFSIHVTVNGDVMDPDPTYGGCNACHGQ